LPLFSTQAAGGRCAMSIPNPIYLGDAVYASSDGNGIELRLYDIRNTPGVVYLEPEVMAELIAFWKKPQKAEVPATRNSKDRIAGEFHITRDKCADSLNLQVMPTSSSYLGQISRDFSAFGRDFLPIWTEEIFSPHSRCWCQGLFSWPS